MYDLTLVSCRVHERAEQLTELVELFVRLDSGYSLRVFAIQKKHCEILDYSWKISI